MRDPFRIDSHKIHLHPERVVDWLRARNDWEKARRIFPIYVEVSPVSYCNHRCTFCGVDYMLKRSDKPKLSLHVVRQMFDSMAINGVKSVMFAGCGEPLLNTDLVRFIWHAHDRGMDTSLTTNGVLLDRAFVTDALVSEHLRWIKVSLNAGDAETYHAIHRGKPQDFEAVLSNLEDAVRVRRELGSSCTLGAQIVALPETQVVENLVKKPVPSNLHTIKPLAERLRDMGLDYLVIKPYSQHLMSESTHYQDVGYKGADEWAAGLEAMSTETFHVTVRRRTMALYEATERGYHICQVTPFLWAYVEADGNVWGCSTYLGYEQDGKKFGDDRFCYGNVNEQPFSDIWRGERRWQSFEHIQHGLDISTCRKNCRMHQANLHLWELTHPGPHVNFI